MQRFEKWAVNSFSAVYLQWYLLPRLFTLMEGAVKGTGLALGPGVGWETLAIAERYPDATLIGVDYDRDQVKRARRYLSGRPQLTGRVAFEQGDATALTFAPETFDFAYELNVLHHVRDYPAAIREVHRVLRPGAPFFLQDLSRHFFVPGLRQIFPPESLFTRAELVAEVAAARFLIEEVRGRAIIFVRARRRGGTR